MTDPVAEARPSLPCGYRFAMTGAECRYPPAHEVHTGDPMWPDTPRHDYQPVERRKGERRAALDAARDAAPELDVERLMVAVFNADQPGDWPTWEDYIAAFGSAGTPPWRRKAGRIAAEYAALARKGPSRA